MASGLIILLATIIAIAGYLLTPDQSPFSNEQHLEIAARKPGYSVYVLKVRNNSPYNKSTLFNTVISGKKSNYTYFPFSKYSLSNDYITITAPTESHTDIPITNSFLLADVLFAIQDTSAISSSLTTIKDIDGESISLSVTQMKELVLKNNIVKRTYWLGTDRFGRDVLSQLMIGTRVSLSVGFISVFISLVLGIFMGALSGYFRGWIDDVIIWLINVVWSIPTLLLVIAITFALGKGFWQVFIAVGLTMWVEVARVVRGQIISLREKEYIEAARALGYSHLRIISKHILPNTLGPVIVISAANFASAILIEAGLSFLGIGIQPPMPSWGTMVKENYAYIILDNPWLALIPGMAIMILVLAFMIIGNGLRDAMDVKTNTLPV